MLTLLMSGALRLCDPPAARIESARRGARAPRMRCASRSTRRWSARWRRRAAVPPPSEPAPADHAIEAYLNAKRERGAAAAAAVWGPNVDASDAAVPSELLRLYLTLKPEKRADVVLGVGANAPPEQIMDAYARRAELIASITADAVASEHMQLPDRGARTALRRSARRAAAEERRTALGSRPARCRPRRRSRSIPPPAPVPVIARERQPATNGDGARANESVAPNGQLIHGCARSTHRVSLRSARARILPTNAARRASELRARAPHLADAADRRADRHGHRLRTAPLRRRPGRTCSSENSLSKGPRRPCRRDRARAARRSRTGASLRP